MSSNIEKLATLLKDAVNEARNGGVATEATYMGGTVIIDGVMYETEIIVPITVVDGQHVWVQRNAGNNKAYIIG